MQEEMDAILEFKISKINCTIAKVTKEAGRILALSSQIKYMSFHLTPKVLRELSRMVVTWKMDLSVSSWGVRMIAYISILLILDQILNRKSFPYILI